MSVFRVQFFFQEFNQGWVEEWYWSGADFAALNTPTGDLGAALLACRTSDAFIEAVRYTQVDVPRPFPTRRFPIGLAGQRPPNGTGGSGGEDVAATSCLMTGSYSDGSSRPNMLRGLADDDVLRDNNTGRGMPSAALRAALTALENTLTTNNFQQQRVDPTNLRNPVIVLNKGVVNGQTDIFLVGTAGYHAGDTFKFQGVPLTKTPWLKGLWTAVGVLAANISIQYPWSLSTGVIPTAMTAQKVTYLYPVIQSFTFEDFRTRKTGRPIFLTRGRARGIPYRRSARVVGS